MKGVSQVRKRTERCKQRAKGRRVRKSGEEGSEQVLNAQKNSFSSLQAYTAGQLARRPSHCVDEIVSEPTMAAVKSMVKFYDADATKMVAECFAKRSAHSVLDGRILARPTLSILGKICLDGLWSVLKWLYATGKADTSTFFCGHPAAMCAGRGRLLMLKWLHERGMVDPARPGWGTMGNPLQVMAARFLPLLQWMHSVDLLNVYATDDFGINVIYGAAMHGSLDVLQWLYEVELFGAENCRFVAAHGMLASSRRVEMLDWMYARGLVDLTVEAKEIAEQVVERIEGRYHRPKPSDDSDIDVLKWLHEKHHYEQWTADVGTAGIESITLFSAKRGDVQGLRWLHSLGLVNAEAKDDEGKSISQVATEEVLAWLKTEKFI